MDASASVVVEGLTGHYDMENWRMARGNWKNSPAIDHPS